MDKSLEEWLLRQGGPVVRWRVATELLECAPEPEMRASLEAALAGHPEVARWLQNLSPSQGIRFGTLHGSFDTCFENALGKLVTLGLRAGMEPLDTGTKPFRDWLAAQAPGRAEHVFDVFQQALVASLLAMAGYTDDPAVRAMVSDRLDTTFEFARQHRYDIYDDPARHRSVPAIWLSRPLIHPDLYPSGRFCLPWIYDLFGFAAVRPEMSPADREKAATVVRYVLDPAYQALAEGYGIIASGGRRYHAMGWDARLPEPGAPAEPSAPAGSPLQVGYWLQRLGLMASFPEARTSQWLVSSMAHVERFTSTHGYLFPKEMLREETGYWVAGSHMGLGENRRSRSALEIESTFWALRIKKTAGLL